MIEEKSDLKIITILFRFLQTYRSRMTAAVRSFPRIIVVILFLILQMKEDVKNLLRRK